MFKNQNMGFKVRIRVNMCFYICIKHLNFFSLKFGIVDADGYLSLYQTNWKCCPVTGSMPKPYLVSHEFLTLKFYEFLF